MYDMILCTTQEYQERPSYTQCIKKSKVAWYQDRGIPLNRSSYGDSTLYQSPQLWRHVICVRGSGLQSVLVPLVVLRCHRLNAAPTVQVITHEIAGGLMPISLQSLPFCRTGRPGRGTRPVACPGSPMRPQ